jgi:transcriptional regulator with XRE-family HTH domain
MPAAERSIDRGTRLGARALGDIAEELREARLGLGVSQEHVAAAARVSRPRYSKIERGKAPTLTIAEAARLGSVLGLDLWLRLYPGPQPLRDAASSRRLRCLLSHVRRPLRWQTEVPLPRRPDRTEQRAWDAVVYGEGSRTAIELEMRLRDGQAVERRVALKRRDDPTAAFLLAIADTRANRRVLADHPDLFADLPRLRAVDVFSALESGRHPPTGVVLV